MLIDEIDVTKQSVDQRANLCARVFQDPLAGTCGALTIEENMALAYMRGKNVVGLGALKPAPEVVPRTDQHPRFGVRRSSR